MRITVTFVAALSALTAAAALAVPTAAAAPAPAPQPRVCASGGAGSACQSPGNVEINIPRSAVEFYPHGYMPYLLGGHR